MDISADLSAKIWEVMDNYPELSDKFDIILADHGADTDSIDFAAIISPATAEYMDFLSKLSVTTEADNWHMAAMFTGLSMLFVHGMKTFPFIRRDDWHLEVTAIDAVLQSFTQVLEHLRFPGTRLDFNLDDPTKSLCAQVLTYFGQVSKQLMIENCSYVAHFTAVIVEAAELAKDVISLCGSYLPEDGLDMDDRVPNLLLKSLNAKFYFPSEIDTQKPQDDLEVLDDGLVGLNGNLTEIKEQLLSEIEQLEIIPITGMGGVGKTTLAARVYADPEIIRQFHVRAWTIASQKYEKRNALLMLLNLVAPLSDEEISKESYEQLGELLCKRLRGRRYLIVVEDIWATDDWDEISQWFPDDENKSRIIFTTRHTEVGYYANPHRPPHCMNLLSVEDSWRLLCQKVFVKQSCPPELVNFGLQIAEKCQGLPLAIVVVAGYLSKMSIAPDCWKNAAERFGSLIDGTQNQFYDILSLSYDDLPQNLKKCFLYMGTFPKNSEIPVEEVIRLWTAAGFLQAERSNCLEEMAEKCLEDLIGRNLITVQRRTFDGRVKTFGIHDLLWDLSLIKARQEGRCIFDQSLFSHSYFDVSDNQKYLMCVTSAYFYSDHDFESDFRLNYIDFKMLGILDILFQSFYHFPEEIIRLVNLRYLALATCSNIPGTISRLGNLETLVNRHIWAGPILPKEIWLLPRLRHLHVGTCTHLPDSSNAVVLPDLQTLSTISSASCTKEVFLKVPNLKQLGIHETGDECTGEELLFNGLNNLVRLSKLEKLKLYCSVDLGKPRLIPQWTSCLANIKKLTLVGSHLQWEEMDNLAMLPNLEVLKLKKNSFQGETWEQNEEFPQLKFLLLQSLDLVQWKANSDHFPNLQRLVVQGCRSLLKVPDEFAEIPNLQSIELDYHNVSSVLSARKVQTEQIDMGNDKFNVQTGQVPIEHRFMWLALVFIYMTLLLKKRCGQYTNSHD